MKNICFAIAVLCCLSCKKSPDSGTTTTPPATTAAVTGITCSAVAASAAPVATVAFTGTITVPYSGGNAVAYSAGTAIASTGVTGLTATLQAGTLASGAGSFTYAISGTAAASGTAYFNIAFGTVSCTASLTVTEPPLTQYGTPFAGVPNRQDATIYQVNMRTFTSASNFQAVTARLDSIKALGVNVVYLMPIFPVGVINSVNSPYCVKDYKAINTEFGTLTDLRNLVDGAHSRNMSVILDWVANHTSWDNAWITTHSDWYSKNGAGTIISPSGYSDVAQLNFANADMRLEMIKDMKYWVYTANVDGFRCDFADNPPYDFWKQAIDTLRNITTHNLLMFAEGSRTDHFTAGFDMIFGFNFYGKIKSIYSSSQPATSLDAINTSEYTNATAGQQVVRYVTNHDVNGSDGIPQTVFTSLRGSIAAFVVAAYMKGVPMIYNGQEVATPYALTFPFTGQDVVFGINPAVTTEYKNIIAFRNSSLAIRRGTLTAYSNADVCAFTKVQGTEKVFAAVNLRNTSVTYTLPAGVANTTFTDAYTGASITFGTTITLPAYGYTVVKG